MAQKMTFFRPIPLRKVCPSSPAASASKPWRFCGYITQKNPKNRKFGVRFKYSRNVLNFTFEYLCIVSAKTKKSEVCRPGFKGIICNNSARNSLGSTFPLKVPLFYQTCLKVSARYNPNSYKIKEKSLFCWHQQNIVCNSAYLSVILLEFMPEVTPW